MHQFSSKSLFDSKENVLMEIDTNVEQHSIRKSVKTASGLPTKASSSCVYSAEDILKQYVCFFDYNFWNLNKNK